MFSMMLLYLLRRQGLHLMVYEMTSLLSRFLF